MALNSVVHSLCELRSDVSARRGQVIKQGGGPFHGKGNWWNEVKRARGSKSKEALWSL